jgi:hypothetical protein
MSSTTGLIWRGAPSIGEDTTAFLSNMLGSSEPELERRYDEKVVPRAEPFITSQVEAVNPHMVTPRVAHTADRKGRQKGTNQ